MYKLDDLGFIAHPRCASRSTRDLLLELGATKHAGHHQLDDDTARNILHTGGVMACTIRNMFDVLVSWYCNAHFNNKGELLNPAACLPTFDYFVNVQLIEKPKYRWFMTPMYFYGLPWCQIRLRYERLQEDTNMMLEMIGLPPVEKTLPHVGKSIGRDPDYRVYYDSSLRRAVEDRWATDLHLTNYEF